MNRSSTWVTACSGKVVVTNPATMTHADIPPEEQAEVGLTQSLVRLSVGMEHVDDLVKDLSQALRRAASGK